MPKRRAKRHPVTQPLDKPYRFIPLTQGQNAIVDVEDFEWLMQWDWQARWHARVKNFVAQRHMDRNGRRSSLLMHRQIMRVEDNPSVEVDHWNHNTLDNRKENLRPCSRTQNAKNRSKHFESSGGKIKGITWAKDRNKWRAQIEITFRGERKNIQLGQFDSIEEARKAYDEGARRFHGEFGCPNPSTNHAL